MEKKIKYIPCTFDDEIKIDIEKNISLNKQDKILENKRRVERSKRKVDYIKFNFTIFYNPVNNFPELILETKSSILKQVCKLGFYSFDSILEYYKLNYVNKEDLFIVQFENLILSFKKYKGDLISDKQKELIQQEQLLANKELLNTIFHEEERIKKWTEKYSEIRKEVRKVSKENKIQNKIQKEAEIERQKQIKELRKKLRQEKKNIVSKKRKISLQSKLDLIPKKLCKCCNKELVYNNGKEIIKKFKERLFCNRSCYDLFIAERKTNNKEARRIKRLEYAKAYRTKYKMELKEKALARKTDKINALPFRNCRNCLNPIPKEKAYLKIKVYERLKFCSKNCEKKYPVKKLREKAEQEKNKLQQKKLKQELIEQEKLLKIKLKEEKLKQKEMFKQAVEQWDNLFKAN